MPLSAVKDAVTVWRSDRTHKTAARARHGLVPSISERGAFSLVYSVPPVQGLTMAPTEPGTEAKFRCRLGTMGWWWFHFKP